LFIEILKKKIMNKEFIPHEESLVLKELGFDEPCFGYFKDGEFRIPNPHEPFKNSELKSWFVTAPLFSQAFRFFREKYNWEHSIQPTADQHRFEVGYNYWIWNSKTGEEYHTTPKNRPTGDWEYETYEQAELECLRKLIEITKK